MSNRRQQPRDEDTNRRDTTITGNTVRQHAGVALAMLAGIAGVTPEQIVERVLEECATCLGHGRIEDADTGALRKCLDCSGTGTRS